ncbi:MAG: hypothetical protein Q9185_003433 [Variospora sp. 1 TL-2023]
MAPADMPYWCYNIPEEHWPAECPDFLLNLSERDQKLVGTRDQDYERLTWPQVRKVIGMYIQTVDPGAQLTRQEDNQLDQFVRVPSDLRRYFEYNAMVKTEHGSVMDFVVKERLKWGNQEAHSTVSCSDPATSDIKILYNDWPYGIDERIVHLVVWTKFGLPDDPETNELTSAMRQEIDDYVERTFCQAVPKQNIDSNRPGKVIWFKNWKALKSIHSVEHFHVMLYDPDLDFVKEVTNNDVPLSRKT